MTKEKNIFSTALKLSSLLMLVLLAWLTVSLPFVYADQQLQKANNLQQCNFPDDNSNPLTNTTEEKTEGGVNSLSEYLHDPHVMEHTSLIITKYYKCHASDLYFAYHPELLSPPPEV